MATTAELRTELVAVVRALDPAVLSGESAAAVVRDLAVIEKAAATGRMFAALRVAQTDAWRGQGHASAADWLAAQAGITVREAASQLGTAKKAERLPKTKAAMRKGDLSPDQAEAVTGAAAADPGAEDSLLDSARNDTTSQLRDKAAKAKAAATDAATRERRIRAARSLRTRTDAEGAFCLSLRGPAIDGVRLQALLRPFEEQAFRAGRTDGIRDTFENRAYDAFYALLTHLQAHAEGPEAPATPAPAAATPVPTAEPTDAAPPPTAAPPARLPGGNNIKVIVRIDHTALARGHTVAGETCEVAGLGPISVATAKVLMDDAFLAAVITRGRDVINVAPTPTNAPPSKHSGSAAPTAPATGPSRCRSTTEPPTPTSRRPASTTKTPSAPTATDARPTTAGTSNPGTGPAASSHPDHRTRPRTAVRARTRRLVRRRPPGGDRCGASASS
jgi:hypothetical protein